MSKFADVIVDVATQDTNKTFQYQIPSQLSDLVKVGSRVEVPFGRRKIQGFVVTIKSTSSFSGKSKNLLSVIDEFPPLNSELLHLSDQLASHLLTYRISVIQTMLPNVLKANYQRFLQPTDSISESTYQQLFQNQETKQLPLNQIKDYELIKLIQKSLKNKETKIVYQVKNKAKDKVTTQIDLGLGMPVYQKLLASIRSNATNQQKLLKFIIKNPQKFPIIQTQLVKEAELSTNFLSEVEKKGWIKRSKIQINRNPLADLTIQNEASAKVLTQEQETAVQAINHALAKRQKQVFLLEGITGSGKTEVYLQTIAKALTNQKQALMLVPEIALTPQMVRQVFARFGAKVAVLHSGLSDGERYDEWRRINGQEVDVVVGARSAIFAPLQNLGLIIIDEEHESTYKQEENPKYHAREVAKWRAKYHQAVLVLGSATPSLESRARAQKKRYQLLLMTKRPTQLALPQVDLIDMTQAHFSSQLDLSDELITGIKQTIAKKQQVILLLNRRGYANFMLCRDCGYVLKCPHCDISLTLHKDTQQMKCHYCGYEASIPKRCLECQSTRIKFFGSGTQKIEELLQQLIPESTILRMDVDTTRRKGGHQKILDAFGNHEADVLLGTQMIAKGLDFENVTLVGVINADSGLSFPDFRSSEKTFDLLTQVSGRAGRASLPGKVLIQTYNPNHYAIQLAKNHNYEGFYQKEMAIRRQGQYPPYFYLNLITVTSKLEQKAAMVAFKIKSLLKKELSDQALILGPTPQAVTRLKDHYYYQILIKYKVEPKLYSVLNTIKTQAFDSKKDKVNIYLDVDPYQFN
ncbi:primosomal protein N' [Holzapfeliella floricola]|uniref:Replication restart protein PriA n=1 Tax=Holzapfeliella floricola DSM 23037 = JCM 16512 TaxID=1423744 RepID=A0A0R2DUS8_9LACO|nr:primosomal protein N' [Holzapfeliella floricola]KRN03844.1 helicase pria essential for oric dnaa-independent dna replication [Holzapfeliella floricola DSM 23037 = JCM 16512]